MDIAAASIIMNTASLQMNASLSVAKKAMENQEVVAEQLLEMLPSNPGVGQIVDVRA